VKHRVKFRSNGGMALPIALGIMMILAIGVVTVLGLTSSSQRHAELSHAEQTSLAAAEAGLNHAESILAQADAMSPTAMPSSGAPATVAVDGGSVQYWGSLDGSVTPHVWTLTATSAVGNPTVGAALSHTVRAQYEVLGSAAGNEAWNYVYSNSLSCLPLVNNFDVRAPLYARGDVCLQNDANFLGPTLDVQGTLETRNTASVGTSASPVPTVRVAGGCRFAAGGSPPPFALPCTAAHRVWASSFNSSPPVVTKPPMDAAYWRTHARPGPNQYCTSGTFPGGPGAFTTLGTVNLTPAASYDCAVVQDGVTLGRLAWNSVSGALTIEGVAYFDGDVRLDGNFNGTYTGRGVVYANTVGFYNDAKLCVVSGCATTGWDPNTAVLVFVARETAATAVWLTNATKFQGGVYSAGGFRIDNTASMQGPVIAESLDIQNAGFIGPWPAFTGLLPGMPSNAGATPYVRRVPGSWRG
jgi:cytoskeletal protein CcmA (bactofilin family)